MIYTNFGGLEYVFFKEYFMTFHLSGIILPTDELIFFRGFETNQYEFIYGYIYNNIYIYLHIYI